MTDTRTLEIPVRGMDCQDCVRHVHQAITGLNGVASADVLLTAEKAIVTFDPALVDLPLLRKAVEAAGYRVPDDLPRPDAAKTAEAFAGRMRFLFLIVIAAVLFIAIAGEWLGLFDALNAAVPIWLGAMAVVATGGSLFASAIRSALRRQITSQLLMSLGCAAALLVGEWTTALVVVFFMRVGAYVERNTAEGARKAVRDLTALAPATARVERGGADVDVPIGQVSPGEVVVVRAGERIPVDGEVIEGSARVDQASITGEPMPVDAVPGGRVFAATVAHGGGLRVRVERVGDDTTFGRVIRMVEQAEAHRGNVQRFADRFAGYYLPVVLGIALITFVLSRNPMSTAAVMIVVCSCTIALATPIAMMAGIGSGARRGLLIKGGRHIEALAAPDVVLLDKTGTVTLGQPRVADIVPLNGVGADEVLRLAASAERFSDHPLARALRDAARQRDLTLSAPESFASHTGLGVRARVDGFEITVGSERLAPTAAALPEAARLRANGASLIVVAKDGDVIGLLGATDALRAEAPEAIARLRAMGARHIELLTGDNERAARPLAEALGIAYRSGLLPEDKIGVVRAFQAQGRRVVMIGDGINDAPALAQADVGIAMGAAGADAAIEAAHVALMRDDWNLVPEVFELAARTMNTVKFNLAFTAVFNLVGLSLAAFGLLPPSLAAAAQTLPDFFVLTFSARLLRARP